MKVIEQIPDKNNVRISLEKVITNKGAAGIDGMKVENLRDYMNANRVMHTIAKWKITMYYHKAFEYFFG